MRGGTLPRRRPPEPRGAPTTGLQLVNEVPS